MGNDGKPPKAQEGQPQSWRADSGLPKVELQHDGVFAPIGGLVIPATNADLFESEPLIEADGGQVARPDLEKRLVDAGGRGAFQHVFEQAAPESHDAELLADAEIEDVRLARSQAHDAIADDLPGEIQRAAGVAHAQAVAKDVFAPGKRVAL